jgi:thiamine transport system permease protein
LLLHGLSAPWQGSQRLTQAIATSLMLAFGSGSFALLLALLRSFSRNDNRIMRFLDFGLLVMPIMVITTGLFLLALRLNIAFKITGLLIIWLNGLMAMPLIVSPLASRVKVFRARYDHLALSLDMSSWAQFRLIYWPALRATLPWCLTLAIVLSVGDLGIAALIGSAQFVTLPILIYQAMGSYQMVLASQLTLVLLLICGALLVAAEWFSERNRHA